MPDIVFMLVLLSCKKNFQFYMLCLIFLSFGSHLVPSSFILKEKNCSYSSFKKYELRYKAGS